MKKKILCIAAAMVLALALAACGEESGAWETCEWPDSTIGNLLPETTAKVKDLSYDEEYISATLKMDRQEYKDYVKACKDAGFTKEQSYSEYDDSCYFDAENEDKYSLSISFDEPTGTADLSLYAPDDVEEEEPVEEEKEEKPKEKSKKSSSSVSSDFKELMDDYESFIDDYVEFMQEYEDSDDITGMMEDYSEMLEKYSEFDEKIDAIDEDELSESDLAYYTKVMARVTEKLAKLN